MSRTKHSKGAPGKEWWSARPFSMTTTGKSITWWFKRATHKIERLRAKRAILREMTSNDC